MREGAKEEIGLGRPTGEIAMLSRPGLVLDVIRKAADAVQKA
jgi:hypothetical protein